MKNKIIVFITMIIISFTMCFGYVSGHYSTDDYHIMEIGYHNYSIQNNLSEGRVVMFLIDQVYNFFHINYDTFIISTICIAIIFTIINIFLLYDLLQQYFKNKTILWILLFSTIFNFMYLESLYFVESIVMSFALIFYTLSAKYFFKEGKYNFIKSFLFNLLAIFCYNALECYFIIIVSFISLMENKKINKQFFFDILKAGFMILLTVLLVLTQTFIVNKIFMLSRNRIEDIQILRNIAVIAYHGIPQVFIKSSYLLPEYVFIGCLLLLFLLSIFHNKRSKMLFENLCLLLICIFSCFCISVFSLSSMGTGRMCYGVGMSIGIVLLNLLRNSESVKKYYMLLIIVSVIWSFYNIINYSYGTYLSKKQNKIEKDEVLQLNDFINQYERENNVQVDTLICVVDWKKVSLSVIRVSALKVEWASQGVINYYTGRNLQKKQITKLENDRYLKQMGNQEYFFDSNTLYVKVYTC